MFNRVEHCKTIMLATRMYKQVQYGIRDGNMLFEYKANGDFRKLRDDFNRLIIKAQDLVNPILADNGYISDCQMYFPAIDLDGNMAVLLFTKLNSLSRSSSSIFETST
jgi:hypothetical protein